MLLNIAGKEAIERSRTFEYAEGESAKNVEYLKRKFKELCEPKKKISQCCVTVLTHVVKNPLNPTSPTLFTNKADSCEFGEARHTEVFTKIPNCC